MKKRSRLRGAYCSDVSSIPRISDELVMEVLSRLGSSKYAIQCKLVSKIWLSLINSSYYMRRWRQINAPSKDDACPVVLLTQCYDIDVEPVRCCGQVTNYISSTDSLEFKFMDNIKVVATHKDVLLCTPDLDNHKAYYLWNPFTMQRTDLPRPSPTTLQDGWTILVGLYVYDDTDNYTFTFKVLRIVLLNSNNDWLMEMFSSENSTAGWTPIYSYRWKRIFPTNYRQHQFPCNCVSYNGMLIWLVKIEREDGLVTPQIIGFKIDPIHDDEAVFVQIPLCLPHRPDVCCQTLNIGKCQERLRLSQLVDTNPIDDYDPYLKLRIWQFDSQRQKWEFVHELDLNEIEDSVAYSMLKSFLECQNWPRTIKVMNFHPYNEDIIYLRFEGPDDFVNESEDLFYVISCDIRKRTFEVIRGFPDPCYPADVFPLLKPCWPTTFPLLPPP